MRCMGQAFPAMAAAKAVSIADNGVRSAHTVGDDASRSCVPEQPAVANIKAEIAIQAPIVCKPWELLPKRTADALPTASTFDTIHLTRPVFIF
jgi:hypothetical protein